MDLPFSCCRYSLSTGHVFSTFSFLSIGSAGAVARAAYQLCMSLKKILALETPPTCLKATFPLWSRQELCPMQENKKKQKLQCSHYKAEKPWHAHPLPIVVYCHCNSGSRRDAEEALYVLLPQGISVFCLDFAVRLQPHSSLGRAMHNPTVPNFWDIIMHAGALQRVHDNGFPLAPCWPGTSRKSLAKAY